MTAALVLPALHGQTQADLPSASETVNLPKFTIEAATDDTFIGKEAMSTTRTGVALVDLPQSVMVVNKEFLNDVHPEYIADIMKYIGGGQTGTLTWAGSTRYMMRGYTTEGDFMDGFKMPPGNTNFNYVDHVEIIKGPSAIFVTNSANTVGGMVNKVSKSPTTYNVGTISAEYAEFDRGSIDLDVGGPITKDKKLQYRVLLDYGDFDRYYDNGFDVKRSIMGMLAYDFSADTRLWIKMDTFSHDSASYNGISIDGRTGKIADVPFTNNLNEGKPLNWRDDSYNRIWGQFTTRPADFLAIRFSGLAYTSYVRNVESIVSPSGTTNPILQPDGSWAFTPYAQYTIPPNYVSGQLLNRTVSSVSRDAPGGELQNDYVFNFATGPVDHVLLIGGMAREEAQNTGSYSSGSTSNSSTSPIDPFHPVFPGTVNINFEQPPTNYQELESLLFKAFVLETAKMLNDRVILNFGVSRTRFSQSSASTNYNQLTGVYSPTTSVPMTTLYKNLTQWGAVVKPLPNVSLFYGYNVNFAANPIQSGQFLPPQEGKQSEFGVKSSWLNGRLNISASYFDIKQLNNGVQPYPQTVPPSTLLIDGVNSKGFDGDISFTVNENLSFIGQFAIFNAEASLRSPWRLTPMPYDGKTYTTLPVNNVSEGNWAVWTRYKFTKGTLKNLSIGVGVNALSKRAITDNANQVLYGYVPGYVLVDANINYETKRFKYQLRIDNLLDDRDYIHAARSNQVILPGYPRNIGIGITYKFF